MKMKYLRQTPTLQIIDTTERQHQQKMAKSKSIAFVRDVVASFEVLKTPI